jgi:hypothetical protein
MRRSKRDYTEEPSRKAKDTGLKWQAKSVSEWRGACSRRKVVGEPYEGKPHVRFDVAGDENQDMVWVIEALSRGNGEQRAAQPKSQAPSLDPTGLILLPALYRR